MSDKEKGIWNGGDTFGTKYDKMIRESEDYYDEIDSGGSLSVLKPKNNLS